MFQYVSCMSDSCSDLFSLEKVVNSLYSPVWTATGGNIYTRGGGGGGVCVDITITG